MPPLMEVQCTFFVTVLDSLSSRVPYVYTAHHLNARNTVNWVQLEENFKQSQVITSAAAARKVCLAKRFLAGQICLLIFEENTITVLISSVVLELNNGAIKINIAVTAETVAVS